MNRHVFAMLVIAGAAGLAGAQVLGTGTSNTFADDPSGGDAPDAANTPGSGITAQFRTSGIAGPTSGTRFLNAEHTGGSFDSWAAIRWDLTDLYADISAQVASVSGATGFEVTGVTLRLTQSPFTFSAATNVNGYYIADDTTDFNPFNVAGTAGAFGGGLVNDGFFTSSAEFAASWFFNNAGGVDSVDIGTASILADLNDISDNFLTFAFEAEGGNAAYRGMASPFGPGTNAPELEIAFNIIPAPGAGALLGIAGLIGARRRR